MKPGIAFPCGLAIVDEEGLLQAVNETLCAIVGRAAGELVGQPVTQLFTPGGRVMHQTYLQPLLRLHGRVEELALSLQAADGQTHDVLVYAEVEPDDHRAGQRVCRLVLVPYRARRAVDDELLRIRRAADQAPGAVFEFRREVDGRSWFPYASEGVHALTGCLPEQLRQSAECWLRRLNPDDRARFGARPGRAGDDWLEHFMVAVQADAEATGQTMPGGPARVWFEVHARARHVDGGAMVWQGYMADVSQRRRLEEEAAGRLAAEQVRLSQTEFLGRVSHELRTPLNAILAFSQLLVAGDHPGLGETPLQQLGLIGAAATQLRQLVDDLIQVSRAEAQGFGVELAALDVRQTVYRSIALAVPQAAEAGVELRAELDAGDLHALADERRLAQVLGNLLSNAIKYNHRGGQVWVRVRARHGELRLTVRDTGPGLTPLQCRSLFRPFERLGAEHSAVPGTGLGLVITRQLVERMGGRIGVESEPGAGSAFHVALPQPPAHAEPRARRRGAGRAPSDGFGRVAPPVPAAVHPTRLCVLYVDDNEVNGQVMAAIFRRRRQAELRVVGTGAEALAAVRAEPPALLLIDLHLPDTCGTQLLKRLRQDPRLAFVPAYLVTAADDGHELARRAGFAGCWPKPLDVEAVLSAFDGACLLSTGCADTGHAGAVRPDLH